MSGTLPGLRVPGAPPAGASFSASPRKAALRGKGSTSTPSGLGGSVSGSGHLRCSSRWQGPSGSSSAQSSRSKHPHPWGLQVLASLTTWSSGSRHGYRGPTRRVRSWTCLLPSRKHRLSASRSWQRTDFLRFPASSPDPAGLRGTCHVARSGITYREVRSMPASTPVTLVLVKD